MTETELRRLTVGEVIQALRNQLETTAGMVELNMPMEAVGTNPFLMTIGDFEIRARFREELRPNMEFVTTPETVDAIREQIATERWTINPEWVAAGPQAEPNLEPTPALDPSSPNWGRWGSPKAV